MTLSRRRFLSISAAAAVAPAAAQAMPMARWRGRGLGADASVTLSGIAQIDARRVFADIEMELERIERVFSLYRPDSAISRLNRAGRLDAPPRMLLEVLELCDAMHRASNGAFDPSVQPLWLAAARGQNIDAARALVGWSYVRFDGRRVVLGRPGMAITLNGIAQGYATDRIAARLTAHGLSDVLVDLGEIAARGKRAGASGWRVGIAAAQGPALKRITLADRCLATSENPAAAPGAAPMQGHIIHPRDTAAMHRLASVSAPTAAVADGLSTAACLLPGPDVFRAVRAFDGARVEYLI